MLFGNLNWNEWDSKSNGIRATSQHLRHFKGGSK
jgi:hypothetical protein